VLPKIPDHSRKGGEKMKKSRKDGIHYNRKFHRWEIWDINSMIYLKYIEDGESMIASWKEVANIAISVYGFSKDELDWQSVAEFEPDYTKVIRLIRKEFHGNIVVTISEDEVRIWVCNAQGENIFRFKALGEIHSGGNDVIVMPVMSKKKKSIPRRGKF